MHAPTGPPFAAPYNVRCPRRTCEAAEGMACTSGARTVAPHAERERASGLAPSMGEDEAVDIVARRHVAEVLGTKASIFPERKLPIPTLRAIQNRVSELADEMRPERASYEVAYDVLAHPPTKREVL